MKDKSIKRYIRKPIVFEVIEITQELLDNARRGIWHSFFQKEFRVWAPDSCPGLLMLTSSGEQVVKVGAHILKDPSGVLILCSSNTFQQDYQEVKRSKDDK